MGGLGAAILGGAAGGGAEYVASQGLARAGSAINNGGQVANFSAIALAENAAIGAATGGLFYGAGKLLKSGAQAVFSKFAKPRIVAVEPVVTPNQLGKEGEELLQELTGAAKNTKAYTVDGRGRIPDAVLAEDIATRSPIHIADAKNVQYQAYTQQLKDFEKLVGPNGRVDIYLPEWAKVSKPLQEAFDNPRNPLFRMILPIQ